MPNATLGRLLRHIESVDTQARPVWPEFTQARNHALANRERLLVEEFFEIARIKLASAISRYEPLQSLGIQVGAKSRSEPPQYAHIESLLRLTDLDPDTALTSSKTFAPVWVKFKHWANENGLSAQWLQKDDGVGDFSWYVLTVEPQR